MTMCENVANLLHNFYSQSIPVNRLNKSFILILRIYRRGRRIIVIIISVERSKTQHRRNAHYFKSLALFPLIGER